VHGLHFGVDAIPLGKHFSVEEDRHREAALVIGRLVQSGRDRVAQLFWREIGRIQDEVKTNFGPNSYPMSISLVHIVHQCVLRNGGAGFAAPTLSNKQG
jgi:hypothetical protein